MSRGLTGIAARMRAFSLRERVLLAITGVMVIAGSAELLIMQPMRQSADRYDRQRADVTAQTQALQQEVGALRERLDEDPNAPVRRRIERLQRRIARQDRRFAELTNRLISPQRMARALERILRARGGLELETLTTEPAEPLFVAGGNDDTPNLGGNGDANGGDYGAEVALYRHHLKLVFRGGFRDTVRYLRALEALPWRFYWSRLDYAVDTYPTAQVELSVYTLSTHRHPLGIAGRTKNEAGAAGPGRDKSMR